MDTKKKVVSLNSKDNQEAFIKLLEETDEGRDKLQQTLEYCPPLIATVTDKGLLVTYHRINEDRVKMKELEYKIALQNRERNLRLFFMILSAVTTIVLLIAKYVAQHN